MANLRKLLRPCCPPHPRATRTFYSIRTYAPRSPKVPRLTVRRPADPTPQLEREHTVRLRRWEKRHIELGKERDDWRQKCETQLLYNNRLRDQLLRTEGELHKMLQKKYDIMQTAKKEERRRVKEEQLLAREVAAIAAQTGGARDRERALSSSSSENPRDRLDETRRHGDEQNNPKVSPRWRHPSACVRPSAKQPPPTLLPRRCSCLLEASRGSSDPRTARGGGYRGFPGTLTHTKPATPQPLPWGVANAILSS